MTDHGCEAIWPIGDGFALACGCSATIQVHVNFAGWDDKPIGDMPDGATVAPQELAVTCYECGSTHWLTVTPLSRALLGEGESGG